MKIKIGIENIEKLKQAKATIEEILSMDLEEELELTEENLKKVKRIKQLCSGGYILTDLKIISPDGTELIKLY